MATDIKNDATLSTGLLSFWQLGEASGSRADGIGSNTLTDNGSVGQTTGVQGDAADFDGTNYLNRTGASSTSLEGMTDLSISLWTKPDLLASDALVSKYDNGNAKRQYEINLPATGDITVFIGTSTGSTAHNVTKSASLTTGTTYHIIMTFDGSSSTVEIFVDGSSIGTGTVTATAINSAGAPFAIGARGELAVGGQNYDGSINNVGIWDKVLSAGEISDLYGSGSGLVFDAGGGGGFAYSQGIVIA